MGLEKASGLVTIEIHDATLHDALRTLLIDANYIYIPRFSASTGTLRSRQAVAIPALGIIASSPRCDAAAAGPGSERPTDCNDAGQEVVSFDGAVPTIATDPFPRGPSPAEAEAARLQANGAFNPDAKESSLLTLSKAADPFVRVRALQTLALQNSNAGFEAINAALSDENPFVRAEATELALVLGGAGPEAARQIGALLDHRDSAVRVSAAMALGEQPGEAAELLLKRALDDGDESVKTMAAQQLQQKESQKNTQRKRKR